MLVQYRHSCTVFGPPSSPLALSHSLSGHALWCATSSYHNPAFLPVAIVDSKHVGLVTMYLPGLKPSALLASTFGPETFPLCQPLYRRAVTQHPKGRERERHQLLKTTMEGPSHGQQGGDCRTEILSRLESSGAITTVVFRIKPTLLPSPDQLGRRDERNDNHTRRTRFACQDDTGSSRVERITA